MLSYSPFNSAGLLLGAHSKRVTQGRLALTRFSRLSRNVSSGFHDISRTELSKNTKLPRFNMPLELGLFLGAKTFGRRGPRAKVCLILDRQKYRYQKFCSDIFSRLFLLDCGHDGNRRSPRAKAMKPRRDPALVVEFEASGLRRN
jgi:hypothetical protein